MLTVGAISGGSYLITFSFTDTDGSAMTPDTLSWSLLKPDGTVVNNRAAVVVAAPAASTVIILSGDDLALLDNRKEESRIIEVEATYTSGTHGALTLKNSETFLVYDPERIKE